MYKDKDKQREANRQASKKYRDSMTDKGMTVAPEIIPKSDIRVIPPGSDVQAVVNGVTRADPPTTPYPKRGKDIKVFEDLPPDVQQTIDSMSVVDGKIDQTIKVNRTAIAINYQHLFPDRYNSTGMALDG